MNDIQPDSFAADIHAGASEEPYNSMRPADALFADVEEPDEDAECPQVPELSAKELEAPGDFPLIDEPADDGKLSGNDGDASSDGESDASPPSTIPHSDAEYSQPGDAGTTAVMIMDFQLVVTRIVKVGHQQEVPTAVTCCRHTERSH